MSVISVKNLNVILNEHRVLENISFEVQKGEVIALVGPNGSGKTTLLKTLLGFFPYQGEIFILNRPPREVGEIAGRIGYVPQRLEFDRAMPVTVAELLSIHLLKIDGMKIREALRAVGAEKLLEKRLGILSGGEFQRVLLALALLNKPEVLLLDEPAAGIDIEGAGELYDLVLELQKQGLTIVLVSHDIDVVFRYASRVLCVNHRLLCQGAPRQALTRETLEELYGGRETIYAHKEKKHA